MCIVCVWIVNNNLTSPLLYVSNKGESKRYLCFSVGVYKFKDQFGVCAYVNEDFNCASAYSVINNVLKVVMFSTRAVGEAVMHLSWLSSRSAGVFPLPI